MQTAVRPPIDDELHSSPYLWLAPCVCASQTAAGIVFLDLQRNKYAGIGIEESRLIAHVLWPYESQTSPLAQPGDDNDQSIIQALVDQGLVTRERPTMTAFPSPRVCLTDRLYSVGEELEGTSEVRPTHLIRFLKAYAWAKRSLRRGPLLPIARELQHLKGKEADFPDGERIVELVSIFRRIRPYVFSAEGKCLLHALTLTKFLVSCRVPCTWVIGVRTKPWGAHSWAQHERLVLDTAPERVVEYTPILSV